MDYVTDLPALYRVYAPVHNFLTKLSKLKIMGKHPAIALRNRMNRVLFKYVFTKPTSVIIQTRKGFLIEVPLNDQAAASIIFEREYSPIESAVLSKLLPLSVGFVDIGANLGYFALLARQLMGELYPIIGIEPNPQLNELIKKSIRRNGFHNINLIQSAVGASEGEARFLFDNSLSSNGSIIDYYDDKSFNVRVMNVNQIANWSQVFGLYLIKVDVEGYEIEALRGSKNALDARAIFMCEIFQNSFESIREIAKLNSYEILDWNGCKLTKNKGFQRTDLLLVPNEKCEQIQQCLLEA